MAGEKAELIDALAQEERLERQRDRDYWQPLRAEVERRRQGT